MWFAENWDCGFSSSNPGIKSRLGSDLLVATTDRGRKGKCFNFYYSHYWHKQSWPTPLPTVQKCHLESESALQRSNGWAVVLSISCPSNSYKGVAFNHNVSPPFFFLPKLPKMSVNIFRKIYLMNTWSLALYPSAYMEGRDLWGLLQPTTSEWSRCFGSTCGTLACHPSLYVDYVTDLIYCEPIVKKNKNATKKPYFHVFFKTAQELI